MGKVAENGFADFCGIIIFLMQRLVLLSAPVLTVYGKFEFRQVSAEQAKEIIRQAEQVESAIGHAATAEVMSAVLDYEVKTNRIEFYQADDDTVLIFKLNKRIGEGRILTRKEIEEIGFEFGILTMIE